MRPLRNNRALRFESLETRTLLAVDVAIAGDQVTITGTAGPDRLTVTLVDGSLQVSAGRGTRLTLQGNGPELTGLGIPVPNPFDLIVNLDAGADDLHLRKIGSRLRNLTVDLGSGHDRLRIVQSVFAGDVSVLAGEGNDVFRAVKTDFRGNLAASLGGGRNEIALTQVEVDGDTHLGPADPPQDPPANPGRKRRNSARDTIRIVDSEFAGLATLHGTGGAFDALKLVRDDFAGGLSVQGFESEKLVRLTLPSL